MKRKVLFAIATGMIASFCIVAGEKLDTEFSLNLSSSRFYLEWMLGALVLSVLIHFSWEFCNKILESNLSLKLKGSAFVSKLDDFENRMGFVGVMLVLLLIL